MSVADKKEITVSEAKAILEAKVEELDPLQRRVLDYATKFTKVKPEDAEKLVHELVEKCDIERQLAVQIANAMPLSVPEVRTFLGRQRIISEDAMNTILMIIKKYRTS
ncbi:MAG: RNA polymerase Rpb4 [Candidatus Bathyarchaeota archaeon]|nr:RNA polymerase Rpb4 [Candidatus Bathyarchaeota archaeon]